MTQEYLFPRRQTRRDFLQMAGAGAAGLALAGPVRAEQKPVRIGSGKSTYTLDQAWGVLPKGMAYGLGCALIVDSKDRIFVTSRSANPCVAIFDSEGKLLETWSKDFADKVAFTPQQVAATAHGLYWSKEGNGEFLYWTENVAGPKDKRIGARVYKTDMEGKVLFQIGNVEKEGTNSAKFDFTNPTDVAVAANGDIYVVDGYGSQKVHRFDKNFKLIKTMGGPGKANGLFNTCHGIWVSTLNKEPEIYIADRHNDRVQVFSLELEFKRIVNGVRNPCCFYQYDGKLFIPDLAARVTIFDEKDKVVAQLGDGLEMRNKKVDIVGQHPEAFAFPHALTVDSKGNMYVIEWVPSGRPRKFKPTPA